MSSSRQQRADANKRHLAQEVLTVGSLPSVPSASVTQPTRPLRQPVCPNSGICRLYTERSQGWAGGLGHRIPPALPPVHHSGASGLLEPPPLPNGLHLDGGDKSIISRLAKCWNADLRGNLTPGTGRRAQASLQTTELSPGALLSAGLPTAVETGKTTQNRG